MAQKLAEEATEVVIEAVRGGALGGNQRERRPIVQTSSFCGGELGITASEIWAEMDRRQALLGMAEKLPKEVGVGSMSSAER